MNATNPTAARAAALLIPCGFAAFAALAAGAGRAAAQEPPEDRWAVTVDLGFTASSGNQRLTVLTSGLRIRHLWTDAFELELTGQSRYGRSEGQEVARNLKGGLSADLYADAGWSPFIFVTAERDPFRRLDLRANGGAGVRRTLIRTARANVSLSAAGLYSHEDRRPAPDAVPEPVHRTARWSWRTKSEVELTPDLKLENVTIYQPVWNRGGDYLIDMDTAVRARLTRRLALSVSHSFDRDATPPEGVRKDDHLVNVGLSIEW